MSAYQPVNMWEGLYIGANVYWPARQTDKLNPCGKVHGFVWDTDDNGIVLEFEQDKFSMRYFISFEDLEEDDCWIPESGGLLMLRRAKFVEQLALDKLEEKNRNYREDYRTFRVKGKRVTAFTLGRY